MQLRALALKIQSFLPIAPLLFLAACQTTADRSLPRGAEAYNRFPSVDQNVPLEAYRLGPLDLIKVTVFQEPELSFDQLQIDASGNLSYPLLGSVRAQGETAEQLSLKLAQLLSVQYLVNPQVSVTVVSSTSQRVTVEGNVNDPGVYEIGGSSTLLESLARAGSPTRVAKLDEVILFRTINGQRFGAVFNVDDVRKGRAPDPQVLGGDVVVVGFSAVKGAFRDFLASAPLIGVFRTF
ncbi:polysaccharide biosynthesis/export family protein [Sphingomonas sp. CJ99]